MTVLPIETSILLDTVIRADLIPGLGLIALLLLSQSNTRPNTGAKEGGRGRGSGGKPLRGEKKKRKKRQIYN